MAFIVFADVLVSNSLFRLLSFSLGYDVKIYDLTAATGNVDTLRYIDEHRLDYFPNMFVTLDAMDNAAAGNLEILRRIYLYCISHALLLFLHTEGHLEAVQYLSNREGCTTDAMDNAASNGHLNVVQWLNENRHEGCTSRAMDDAAGNGRLDILQYLTEMHVHNNRNVLTSPDANVDTLDIRNITTVSGTPVITSRAIDLAAEHGHIDVLKFIRARYNSYLTTIHNVNMTNNHTLIGPSRLAFDLAAGNGHLEVLEFLVENYENLCSVASIELAARSGHVHVLQWFFEKFPEMFA